MAEIQKGESTGMTLSDQIEVLKEARAGLHMWHMDTSGVDRMLAQHGVDISALPKHNYGAPCEKQQAAKSAQ